MAKKYDVVARVGSYMDKNNHEKGKYKTVGMIYEKDGKQGLMIDTPIVLDDEGNVVKFFGLYEPRSNDGQNRSTTQSNAAPQAESYSDDVPF